MFLGTFYHWSPGLNTVEGNVLETDSAKASQPIKKEDRMESVLYSAALEHTSDLSSCTDSLLHTS